MDILNNHEHYNKFQSIEGMRIKGQSLVKGYLLENRIKKAIRKTSKKNLNQLAVIAYGGIGYNSYDMIKVDLENKIESCNTNTLYHILELISTEGLYEGLLFLTKLSV